MNPILYNTVIWFGANPWVVFMIFPLMLFMISPLMLVVGAYSFWREHRRLMKKENNPRLMDTEEYKHFNRKRFKEL